MINIDNIPVIPVTKTVGGSEDDIVIIYTCTKSIQ